MRLPYLSLRIAGLTTLLALSALYGCSTNEQRGDNVTWDPNRPDKQLDPVTQQQYRDAQERERQRQTTVVSAKSTVKPKS